MALVYSWRLAMLIASYQVCFDFGHFVMYILLAKTTYACDFEHAFGMYYGIRAGALVARKLVTGPLTDATGQAVHWCLRVCVLAQIVVQGVMYFGGWSDAWAVIGLQLGLGSLTVQAQTCVLKIIKLHLEAANPGNPDVQHALINDIEAWGEGLATGFIAVATFIAYMVATRAGASFAVVQWIILGIPLLFSLLTLVLAFSIDDAFIAPDPLVALYASTSAPSSSAFASISATSASAAPFVFSSPAASRPLLVDSLEPESESRDFASAPLLASASGRGGRGGHLGLDKEQDPASGLRYVVNGFRVIAGSPVLVFSILIYLVCFTYSYVVYVTLTLSESQGGTDGAIKTRDNFCNGVITNLFLQAAILNVVYAVGSVAYALFLAPLKPLPFFAYFLPAAALFLAALTYLLVLDLSSFESAWVLAVLSFLSFAYYLYVQNMALATAPSEYMGMLWSVLGVLGSALLYVPSVFTTYGTPVKLVITIAAAMMVIVALLSLAFVAVARKSLRSLSHADEVKLFASVSSAYGATYATPYATTTN